MAGNSGESTDQAQDRLVSRLRLVTVRVILFLVVLTVVTDDFGRLFVNPNFHASELILGTLFGALLPILGVVGLTKLPSITKKKEGDQ